METGERAKLRLEALNLAYGILLNESQVRSGVPTTEAVLAEAKKILDFIERA